MKIDDIWAEYKECTQALTSTSRKLSFGAAAICWFFKTPEATFPTFVIFSLLSVVFFFTFDILQFLVAALSIRGWARKKQKEMLQEEGNLEAEVYKPSWINRAPFLLFLIKIVFLFISFFWLGAEFYKRIF